MPSAGPVSRPSDPTDLLSADGGPHSPLRGRQVETQVEAGILLGAEGLHPSSKGARVKFSGDRRTVVDGPFAESKELIAGFWLFQVTSKEEAIEWVKRCPSPTGFESEIEIRQVFEPADPADG
jgi:hypothetical protein